MFKRLVFLSVFLISASTLLGQVIGFDKDEEGKAPKGFIFGLTGKGKPGLSKRIPRLPQLQTSWLRPMRIPSAIDFPFVSMRLSRPRMSTSA